MKNPTWFWAMKKANSVLIWDSFTYTNFNAGRFFEIPHDLEHYKVVNSNIYFGQKSVDLIREAMRKKILADVRYPARIAKKIYETEKRIISNINKFVKKDIKKCSNEELCKIFSKCYREISIMEIPMSYRGNVQLSDVLTEMIKQELTKKLNKKGKLGLLEEYFLVLSMPKKDSQMAFGQKRILGITSMIQNDNKLKGLFKKNTGEIIREIPKYKDFHRKLKKHIEEFSWTGCVMFMGLPLTIENFIDDIKSKLGQDCKAEIERIDQEKRQNEAKIKKIVKSLGFFAKTKLILEHLREWYHLRTYAKDCISRAIARTMPVLLEIAARKNMTYDDLSYLQAREVENIFKIPNEELLNRIGERKKGWAAVATKEDVYYYTGEDIKKVEEKEEIDKNVVEIKGQVASRGFVKGVVRFVKDATELSKVKKGDILVTSMTTTDFTPVLGKLSGLITDEGGLTCHAAIVSRELGIPCVIGTKFATKILKDDDRVELDAEKGIVRKI